MIDPNTVRATALEVRAMLGGPIVIYLHPTDLATLTPEDRQQLLAGGGIRLVARTEVGEGGHFAAKDKGIDQ